MGRSPASRRRFSARWAIAVVLLACLGAGALPAGASPSDRLERVRSRKDEVAHRLHDVKAHGDDIAGLLDTLDAQAHAIRHDVARLAGKIDHLDAHIDRVKARLTRAQKRLDVLTAHLEVLLARLDHRTSVFEARAVAAYEAGPTAYAESILSSETFSDLVDRVEYHESALAADSALIDRIEVARTSLEEKRSLVQEKEEEISAAKLALENDRAEVERARSRRAAALDAKQRVISEKSELLGRIRGHQHRLEAQEARLQRESDQLEAVLQQEASTSATSTLAPSGGGQLMWPATGPITSGFGWRIHPIFGTRMFHTGIDIGVPMGTPVLAADAGRVVYAGAMSGYGNVVMIDHGGGLATLYGHLSAFSVANGQAVARGQRVASSGCTGYCTGPHLHFEVRVNGAPVDPMPYLQ